MNAEPDTRWELRADGRVVVSGVWLELVGRHNVEAPGYRWSDFVHVEDREIVEVIAAHIAARRCYAVAFRIKHHLTGRYIWVHVGGKPQADGSYVGWTRIARNDLRLIRRIAQAVCLVFVVA